MRFGDFELNLQSGELSRNGSRLLLPYQPFRLLAILIRARGTLVTREDLQRELWSEGTFVDFEPSLNAAVKRLREALGDSAAAPRFIETLPRRGYRFIASVTESSEPPRLEADSAPFPTSLESDANGAAAEPASHGVGDRAIAWNSMTASARAKRLAGWSLKSALVVVALIGLIAFTLNRGPSHESADPVDPRITRVTSLGTVRVAALSPDAERVAYVRADGVRESLWVRKLSEPNPVQLLEPVHGTFRWLTLGPTGFVYYNLFRPTDTVSGLYRLSPANGAIEKISDAAAGVAFSLDGARMAYISTASMVLQESHLVVGDASGTNTRTLAVRRAPDTFVKEVTPAWSPDGTQLAVFATSRGAPQDPQLLLIDAHDGRVRGVRALGLVQVRGPSWLPDGKGLIMSARERRVSPLRLWHVSIASGARRALTHDVSDYTLAGVTRDGRRLVAVRGEVARSFWAAAVNDPAGARQVAVDSGNFGGLEGVAWAPDDRLLYATGRIQQRGHLEC